MAVTLNSVTISGRLTREPESHTFETGSSVVRISLAINEHGSDGVERTHYVDCDCWGKVGKMVATYTRKGSLVVVEGRLQMARWDKDGTTHTKLYVSARRVHFVSEYGKQETVDLAENVPF